MAYRSVSPPLHGEKVKEKLGYTIRKTEEHCLEAKYRLHLGMREYLTYLLGLESGLWKVCIIDDAHLMSDFNAVLCFTREYNCLKTE